MQTGSSTLRPTVIVASLVLAWVLCPSALRAETQYFLDEGEFLDAAGPLLFESFESVEPTNEFDTDLVVVRDFVVSVPTPETLGVFSGEQPNGAHPTHGAIFLHRDRDVLTTRLIFTGPIHAIGLTVTDWGEFGGEDITISTDAGDSFPFITGVLPGGNEVFVGLINPDATFLTVTLTGRAGQLGDAFGLDGVHYSRSSSMDAWYDDYDFEAVGAVAYWPFDGDSEDKTGNGNTGAWTGGRFTRAVFETGFRFAPGDYYEVVDPPWLQDFDELTMAAWFRAIRTPLASESLLGMGVEGGLPHYFLFIFPGGEFAFEAVNASGRPVGTPPVSYSDRFIEIWHHLAVTFDGETSRAYLDGIEVAKGEARGRLAVSGESFFINKHRSSSGESSSLFGVIDDAVVFSRALEPAEVFALSHDVDHNGIADLWVRPAPGGSVHGIATHGVVCWNQTTGQRVVVSTFDSQWDCEALGLVVSPGDRVVTGGGRRLEPDP